MDEQAKEIKQLRQMLTIFYTAHGRHALPWRQPEANGAFDPYKIVVSELMLQQTQVPRVVPKFADFIAAFPTFAVLAAAPLGEVLRAWSGLGYNRRAKFLWQTAGVITEEFSGKLPCTRETLVRLPGIGPNTAGAILAYAFNRPTVFVETNIRTVLIHHFFGGELEVSDTRLLPIIEKLLADEADPRTFYWSLMDYGTYLKQTVGNVARASRSYARQTVFAGSRRQLRGRVLRELASGPQTPAALRQTLNDERLSAVLSDLLAEQLITRTAECYNLP